jgi:hypothetical protein
VPKKAHSKNLATNKMQEGMSPEKRYGKGGRNADIQFDKYVIRILNGVADPFLNERHRKWINQQRKTEGGSKGFNA